MQNENGLTPGERELVTALGGLRPAEARISRDELMFQAGRMSSRGAARTWRSVAALLGCVLAVSLAMQIGVETSERREIAEAVAPTEPTVVVARGDLDILSSGTSYLRIRDDVLARGVDALPQPEWTTDTVPAAEEMDELLLPFRWRGMDDDNNHSGNS